MSMYITKNESASGMKVVLDDMILTKEIPTTAGSKMLDGYVSLFEAEVITRLTNAGYVLAGKSDVGEFNIDLLGETSYNGAIISQGNIKNASAEIIKSEEAIASINLDVNGVCRRACAQNDLVSIKPTYGTVSRYGVIAVACSGETVSVMSNNTQTCQDVLDVIAGHDNKDGTSLDDNDCAKLKSESEVKSVKKVAILSSMLKGIDRDISAKIEKAKKVLQENSVELCVIDDEIICLSRPAWNILMSAELCNNVSKYDGVKYGYRAQDFSGIDELYTNSRTQAFGELLKKAILFGSDTLSTENYKKVYDKALRSRRVILNEFNRIFVEYDAILIPACSTLNYSAELIDSKNAFSFEENYYTAPASITGLPAVVVNGVQFVGKAFSERALLSIAKLFEKEGK